MKRKPTFEEVEALDTRVTTLEHGIIELLEEVHALADRLPAKRPAPAAVVPRLPKRSAR